MGHEKVTLHLEFDLRIFQNGIFALSNPMVDKCSVAELTGKGALKITHPGGVSMALSERLSSFLAFRLDRAAPFRVGHWLQVVDDETLAELQLAVLRFDEGDVSAALDDLLTLIIIALSAETRRPDHDVDELRLVSWVETLGVALSVEAFRRCGWLHVEQPVSIQPEERTSLKLTAEGMRRFVGVPML